MLEVREGGRGGWLTCGGQGHATRLRTGGHDQPEMHDGTCHRLVPSRTLVGFASLGAEARTRCALLPKLWAVSLLCTCGRVLLASK